MAHHSGNRRRVTAVVGVAAVAATLVLAAGNSAPAGAAAPPGYAADDVIGQTGGSGNPVFTTSARNNNGGSTPSASGVDDPRGTALDVAGHRLFAADCGNDRVLVFNLDAQNDLSSRSASFVIGQPNFTTVGGGPPAQNNLSCPSGPSYDAVHKRLFVTDSGGGRVLEFDLSSGISNGMNASHVLGEPDFTTSGGSCLTATAATLCDPHGGSAYDPVHDRLFVPDTGDARVMVWDLRNGITNGMNAAAELGQPDFTTTTCAVTRSGLTSPSGAQYDASRQLLYVADDKVCGAGHAARVMVWDLSSAITNGMNAVHILGKTSYTDGTINADPRAAIDSPEDLSLDAAREHLYVQDDVRNRVLVFNVTSITDGEEATAVVGQPDFVTTTTTTSCQSTPSPTRYDQCDAGGGTQEFDVANNGLYLSDSSYNRVLLFRFVQIDSTMTPDGTVAVAYRAGIQSRGSQGSVSYAVSAGTLPPGLSLDAASGLITGTPSTAGPYSFVVTVTDDNGAIGTFSDSQVDFILVGAIPDPATGGAAG